MPDEEIPSFTIVLKEGEITRLHAVMCGLCHGTVTLKVHDQELFERDLIQAGWKQIQGLWFCPECG